MAIFARDLNWIISTNDDPAATITLSPELIRSFDFQWGVRLTELAPPRRLVSIGRLVLNDLIENSTAETYETLSISAGSTTYMTLKITDWRNRNIRRETTFFLSGYASLGEERVTQFSAIVAVVTDDPTATTLHIDDLNVISTPGAPLWNLSLAPDPDTEITEISHRKLLNMMTTTESMALFEDIRSPASQWLAIALPFKNSNSNAPVDTRSAFGPLSPSNSNILTSNLAVSSARNWAADEYMYDIGGRHFYVGSDFVGQKTRNRPRVMSVSEAARAYYTFHFQSGNEKFRVYHHFTDIDMFFEDNSEQDGDPVGCSVEYNNERTLATLTAPADVDTTREVIVKADILQMPHTAQGKRKDTILANSKTKRSKRLLPPNGLTYLWDDNTIARIQLMLDSWDDWTAALWGTITFLVDTLDQGNALSIPDRIPSDRVSIELTDRDHLWLDHVCIVTRVHWRLKGGNPLTITWDVAEQESNTL